MIDVKLTKASGRLDIEVINGVLQVVEGPDELAQRVEFKLEFFQNDWMHDLGFGIPYFGRVLKRGVDITDLYGVFSFAISEEPGIAYVQELRIVLDPAMRALSVTGSALSESGAVVPINTFSGGI